PRPPRYLSPSPQTSFSSMRLTQVESSSRNPSTPRRRCRHKSLTDRLKPSDACCPSCAGWTDTSAALPRGETERFLISCDRHGHSVSVGHRSKEGLPAKGP